MDSNKEWYYLGKDRKITGPLTGDALSQLVAAGVISDQTLIAVAGTENWVPYLQVDSLDLRGDARVERKGTPVIKIKCLGCGQRLSVTPDQEGMTCRCPNCNGQVVVPSIIQPVVQPTTVQPTTVQPTTVQPTTLLDDNVAIPKGSSKPSSHQWLVKCSLAPWMLLLLFLLGRLACIKFGWISFGNPLLSPACWVIAGLPIIFVFAGHFFGSDGQSRKLPVLSSASMGTYGVVFLVWLIAYNIPIRARNIPGTWRNVVEPNAEIVFDTKGGYLEVGESENGRLFSQVARWGKWTIEEGRLVLTPSCSLGTESSVFEMTSHGFYQSKENGRYNPFCTLSKRIGDVPHSAFARLKGTAKTWKTILDEMIEDNFDAQRGEAMVNERLEENADGFRIVLMDEAKQQLAVTVELETSNSGGSPNQSRVRVLLPVRDISREFQPHSDIRLEVGLEPTAWEKRLEVLLDTLALWTPVAVKRQETVVQPIKTPQKRVAGDTATWGTYFFYADPGNDTYWIFQNAYGLGNRGDMLRSDESPRDDSISYGPYGVPSLESLTRAQLPPRKPLSAQGVDAWTEKASSDTKRFVKAVHFDEYVFGAHEIHLWRHLIAGLPRYRELARGMLAKKLGDLGAVERDRLARENEAKAREAELRASEERARKEKMRKLDEAFPQPGS